MSKVTKKAAVTKEINTEVDNPIEEIKDTPVLEIEEKEAVEEEKNEVVEVVKEKQQVETAELSNEEKIISFIENAVGSEVKLNDFIKSLYPLPTFTNPAIYLNQGESRKIRAMVSDMVAKGQIFLKDNRYLQLGSGYYEGTEQKLKHYNITNVEIIVKK